MYLFQYLVLKHINHTYINKLMCFPTINFKRQAYTNVVTFRVLGFQALVSSILAFRTTRGRGPVGNGVGRGEGGIGWICGVLNFSFLITASSVKYCTFFPVSPTFHHLVNAFYLSSKPPPIIWNASTCNLHCRLNLIPVNTICELVPKFLTLRKG